MGRACAHCSTPLPKGATKRRLYCGHRCAVRAGRRLKAGLPEDFAPAGFRRGSISLQAVAEWKEEQAEYVTLALASGPLRV